MNRLQGLALLMPEWMLPWVAVAAVAAWILGARRAAIALGLFFAMDVLVAPALAPWLAEQPAWALALLTLAMGLMMLQGLLTFLFGRGATDHFVGTWLVRIVDLLLLGPFRVVLALLRLLMTGH